MKNRLNERILKLAGIDLKKLNEDDSSPWGDANDATIANTLEIFDKWELIDGMMGSAEQNPQLTLMDYLKQFDNQEDQSQLNELTRKVSDNIAIQAYKQAHQYETGEHIEISSFDYDDTEHKETMILNNVVSNGEELGQVVLVNKNYEGFKFGIPEKNKNNSGDYQHKRFEDEWGNTDG